MNTRTKNQTKNKKQKNSRFHPSLIFVFLSLSLPASPPLFLSSSCHLSIRTSIQSSNQAVLGTNNWRRSRLVLSFFCMCVRPFWSTADPFHCDHFAITYQPTCLYLPGVFSTCFLSSFFSFFSFFFVSLPFIGM